MKILIVTPYFWPHPGGVESYSLNIAKQLTRDGHEVVIIMSSINGRPARETVQGMRVYRLKTLFSVSNTPVGWRWRAQLKKIYAAEKPDIINGHMPVPYLADTAERCRGRIPFVLTYHNDLSKSTPVQKLITSTINRTVIRRTLCRSDHIIATSQYYTDTSPLLRRFAGKVSTVPPGVDTALFNPGVKVGRDLERKYQGERIILFAGSISKNQQHKGVDTLIKAFAHLRSDHDPQDTRLVIVGAGDGKDMHAALADELGVGTHVEFTGFVPDALLAQYYKRASVLAMPSRDRSEGFGMVFMEAGAVGTPVVGTNVGGIPYAIQKDKTGLIVPPDDVPALERALKKLLTDAALARRLGDAGAKRAAAEFNWELLARQTAKILAAAARPTVIQIAGYYPPSLGGMERVAQAVSEHLAGHGYDVRVFTSSINQPANPPAPRQPRLTIQRFKAIELAHTAFAPGFIPALFKTPKHSVFHLHLSQAFYPEWTMIAAKLRRIPYVVHFHLDLQPSGPLGALFIPYKALIIRTVIKHASSVIVFSPEQQRFIHKTYGVANKKIAIIPNGVDAEYLAKRPKQGIKRGGSQAPSLLYVGRVSSQKRVGMLVSALARMQTPARLTIVGDGEERAAVEAMVPVAIANRVIFTGQLPPAKTLPYFKSADVFVMASKVEGMPLALLEAMAAGLPVVGADVPGIRELVGGVGILVKNPSPETFARALDELLAKPAALKELSQKSLQAAKRYSWPALVDQLEQLYRSLR